MGRSYHVETPVVWLAIARAVAFQGVVAEQDCGGWWERVLADRPRGPPGAAAADKASRAEAVVHQVATAAIVFSRPIVVVVDV